MSTSDNTMAIRLEAIIAPTKKCLVCGCYENPNASVAYSDKAWLCERCRTALLKIVESEDTK